MLLKCGLFASLKSRSENSRQTAMLALHTQGCSMRLHHPIKRVSKRRGMRLVSRKLMSSCPSSRAMQDFAVILMSFACNTVRACLKREDSIITTIGYVMAGLAAAFLLRKLYVRLQLSQAKHRSLTGHSRMARRFAS